MSPEMFDAVQPYLAAAQDVRGGHGARGEPGTGSAFTPVETPAPHTSVDPGVPAPPTSCVNVGDVAAHLPPGSTTDVGSEDMEVPVAVPPVAVEPPAAPSDPTTLPEAGEVYDWLMQHEHRWVASVPTIKSILRAVAAMTESDHD